MKKLLLTAGLLILTTSALVAQYGKAPPGGKYPPGYSGNTFTGLAGAADSAGAIKIVHVGTNYDVQTFVGKFQKPCSVPHPDDLLRLPTGTLVTVFFNPGTASTGGQKATENQIIGMVIKSWEGSALPKAKQVFISCSGN